MPPSDDTQELIAATSGNGDTSSSSVVVANSRTTSTTTSAKSPPPKSLTLQDQLSDVFEAKMTNITMGKENAQNIERAEEGSSHSSSIDTSTTPEKQQPQSLPLTEQGVYTAEKGVPSESPSYVPAQQTNETTSEDDAADAKVDESTTDTTTTSKEREAIKEGSEGSQEEEAKEGESSTERDGPLAMLRKGAVAAVGGTMVRRG